MKTFKKGIEIYMGSLTYSKASDAKVPNIVEANGALKISKGMITGYKGWEKHSTIVNTKKELMSSKKQFNFAMSEIESLNKYVKNIDKYISPIKTRYEDIVRLTNEYINEKGNHFARKINNKEYLVEDSSKELKIAVTDWVAKQTGFHTSREFLTALVEVKTKTERIYDWVKRNREGHEEIVEKFVCDLLNLLLQKEHLNIQRENSKFLQVNKDAIWKGKSLKFSYIERQFESVKTDIVTAESKLGWSTAFFSIIISILVSIGLTYGSEGNNWIWIGIALIPPLISFMILIWGMSLRRSSELTRVFGEEKILFLKRKRANKMDWQEDFGRADVARLIAAKRLGGAANINLVRTGNCVYYEKEKLIRLVNKFSKIAKHKASCVYFSSAMFLFPLRPWHWGKDLNNFRLSRETSNDKTKKSK